MKKLKAMYNKMSQREKKIVSICLVLLCIGTITSAWAIYYEPVSSTGFIIKSSSPIEWSSTFSLEEIDVTNETQEKMEYIEIDNRDGERDLELTYNTTIIDEDDLCTLEAKDWDVTIEYCDVSSNCTEITTPSNITASSGISYVNVTTEAERDCCPANLSTTMTIQG